MQAIDQWPGDDEYFLMDVSHDPHGDTADVVAPPPVLFGMALVISLALHKLHALHLARVSGSLLYLMGGVLIVLGLVPSIAVVRAFGGAGTPVPPYRPTTHFVTRGPYRYTRNPDYIGQTLVYIGIAVPANSWWPLVLLPFVLVAIQYGVIHREERYLERKFGQEYRDYTARVPRWL